MEDCDQEYAEEGPKQYGDWLRVKGNNGDSWIMEGRNYKTYSRSSNTSINQIQHAGNTRVRDTTKKLELMTLIDSKSKKDQ